MRSRDVLEGTLAHLAQAALLREPDQGLIRPQVAAAAARLGLALLDASSNDYLGLAEQHVSRETPNAAGAAAARLIYGTRPEHLELESTLARWVGAPTALLFSSTYAANLGTVSALGVEGSLVLSDASNHASLIDGARLARAEVKVVPHLDLDALRAALRESTRARAVWVLTESYFSMDGDGPDLPALRRLCDEYDAFLLVDEAHALGVFGPGGAGRCAESGIHADALVGALGKAVGSHGGFVAGSAVLRDYLWNFARSFVFSTALSPAHAALTQQQVRSAEAASGARARLDANTKRLREKLATSGQALIAGSFGPIVSINLRDNERALAAAARLRSEGILAQAIRPPTVPLGAARLRLTIKATFSDDDITRLARAVEEACLES